VFQKIAWRRSDKRLDDPARRVAVRWCDGGAAALAIGCLLSC
jgi:hypothetical protein